jgi:bifunctional DNase/RNase
MRRARTLAGIGLLGLTAVLLPGGRPSAKPAPAALVEAEVLRVGTLNGQAVVLLRAKGERRLLPIWIGEAEANAIHLRLTGQRPPRPLTHDLLDRVMAGLGGRLSRVHVEDLRENVFYGRVFLRQGTKELDLDARPSDAIALAVGAKVPVLVARKVLDAAGVEDKPVTPGGDKDISL